MNWGIMGGLISKILTETEWLENLSFISLYTKSIDANDYPLFIITALEKVPTSQSSQFMVSFGSIWIDWIWPSWEKILWATQDIPIATIGLLTFWYAVAGWNINQPLPTPIILTQSFPKIEWWINSHGAKQSLQDFQRWNISQLDLSKLGRQLLPVSS